MAGVRPRCCGGRGVPLAARVSAGANWLGSDAMCGHGALSANAGSHRTRLTSGSYLRCFPTAVCDGSVRAATDSRGAG